MLAAKDCMVRFPTLTEREASILACFANGCDNATVAALLGITERTVKNTAGLVFLKVGAGGGGSARVRAALLAHGLPVWTPPTA